jgi:hypothetical protein
LISLVSFMSVWWPKEDSHHVWALLLRSKDPDHKRANFTTFLQWNHLEISLLAQRHSSSWLCDSRSGSFVLAID